MSARHHHRHLYRLYTTRSRRVFLCIVINARTNRERNWEKLMRKSNESIPHWTTSRNRISLSLFIRAEQLSLSSPRGVKKERKNNKKKPRETRRWKHHSLSLSSYLTSLVVFINNNTPQFKDDFTFVLLLLLCLSFSFWRADDESAKKKKTLNTRSRSERPVSRIVSRNSRTTTQNRKHTQQHGGEYIIYI